MPTNEEIPLETYAKAQGLAKLASQRLRDALSYGTDMRSSFALALDDANALAKAAADLLAGNTPRTSHP